MNKKDLKREFNGRLSELRKIINSYELIPDAPSDEFDSINHQVLSNLYRGADVKKITRIIESELITNYGFFADEIVPDKMALEVIEWWQSL